MTLTIPRGNERIAMVPVVGVDSQPRCGISNTIVKAEDHVPQYRPLSCSFHFKNQARSVYFLFLYVALFDSVHVYVDLSNSQISLTCLAR